MKKYWQISLIVLLALALLCMAFSVKGADAKPTAGMVRPQVGWHTGSVDSGSPLALKIPSNPAMRTPNVGWRG